MKLILENINRTNKYLEKEFINFFSEIHRYIFCFEEAKSTGIYLEVLGFDHWPVELTL